MSDRNEELLAILEAGRQQAESKPVQDDLSNEFAKFVTDRLTPKI